MTFSELALSLRHVAPVGDRFFSDCLIKVSTDGFTDFRCQSALTFAHTGHFYQCMATQLSFHHQAMFEINILFVPGQEFAMNLIATEQVQLCLLYTSDAADE